MITSGAGNLAFMQVGNRRGLVDREELITLGQASLDIFWLRDQSLEESDNPALDVLVREIVVPRLTSLGTTPSQGYG
jgi:hypothetical protein